MQNQSIDMKTVIETYLVEETINLLHDGESLEKWNDQISFLGLDGQKTIVKNDKSPIPFLWMNTALINVFKCLCPADMSIEKYDKMPIPLEILELVSLSKREGYFDFIKIWYDEKSPDPVCVGYRVPDEHKSKDSWYQLHYSEKYLMGRWSDVKASFAELMERARFRYIGSQKNEMEQKIKDAKRALEDLEANADAYFGLRGNTTELPF